MNTTTQRSITTVGKLAPIAIFAYKRVDCLRQAIQSILANSLSSESHLFIFCDAPKRLQDVSDVEVVREYVRHIQGFKSISIIERSVNFGLARSIVEGVSYLCSQYGKAIVIEDDIVVSSQFLEYMNFALQVYADKPKVFQISGYMYPGYYEGTSDGLFLTGISCWGWGTWKRAWDLYDPFLSGIETLRHDKKLRRKFNLNDSYDYYDMAQKQLQGYIDSWGICWQWSVFRHDGLVLYPRRNMVKNIGVETSYTHGGHSSLHIHIEEGFRSDNQCFQFPLSIQIDLEAQEELEGILCSLKEQSPLNLKIKIRSLFSWLLRRK